MKLDEIIIAFVQESDELLTNMEDLLLSLESNPQDTEALNGIFRAVHTIKGSAGMFGFDWIVKFSHVLENLLDSMREGKVAANKEIIENLLVSKDYLSSIVKIYTDSTELTEEKIAQGEILLSKLKPFLLNNDSKSEKEIEKNKLEKSQEQHQDEVPGIQSKDFHISLRPSKQAFINALDPYSFIKYTNQVGTIEFIKTIITELPDWNLWDPESCYLGFEIRLSSTKTVDEIRKVFEFLEYDSKILILQPNASIEDVVNHLQTLSEDEILISNILTEMKTLTQNELIEVLESFQSRLSGIKTKSLNQFLNKERENTKNDTKLDSQKSVSSTLRVDSHKIDHLINKVGELVVSEANLSIVLQNLEDSTVTESLHSVSRLINEIREISLKLRMVPIGESFNKYHRIVRDLGSELSKKVNLHIHGGETELDKSVVEKLSDPMVHLIRNAVDHGLETVKERLQYSKEETGNVYLNAFHDTGSIVIEISDDGKGVNTEKVLRKAIEKGILSPDSEPSTDEIHKLLFHPGFSTADQITNISGRGVGLDVVQKNIEALRGSIQLFSKPGEGTKFTIRLPLTLAIIDGFLVSAGKDLYVIPLDLVRECVEFKFENENNDTSGNYFNLRGKVLPYTRLDYFFHNEVKKNERENIVITEYQGNRIGLVVDKLYGEIQTVIKPLAKVFSDIRGIGGSTTLGDGRIALILDVADLHESLKNLQGIKFDKVNIDTHEGGALG